MNRNAILCLAAVCFLSAGSATHADQISYSFSTPYPTLFLEHGSYGVFVLTNSSGNLPQSITTSTKPVTIGTGVLALSLAHSSAKQQISAPINLTLTDTMSNGKTVSDTVSLGVLSGPLWRHGSDLDFHSSGVQKVTFGSHTYQISFAADSIHPRGPFLSMGRLTFSVSDPPNTHPSPEPSSLVLAGIGLPLLGAFLRRRRA
jgi:hypothetical protein